MTNTGFFRRLALILALVASLSFFFSPPASAQIANPSDYFNFSYNIGGLTPPPQVSINQPFTVSVTGQVTAKIDLPGLIAPFATGVTVTGKIIASHSSGTQIVLNPGYTVNLSPIPKTAGQTLNINQSLSLQFPAGSPPGDYTVAGELVSATVQPLNIDLKTLLALPGSQNAGSVTLLAPVSPPVIVGGGGGGSSVFIPVIPSAAPKLNISVSGETRQWDFKDDGSTAQEAKISSPDSKITLSLAVGTYIRDQNNGRVESLSINIDTSPPQAPQGRSLIGSPHNLGPNGTKFQPPVELTLTYDDKLLPKNVAEKDLFIAYWDSASSKWVPLESQVDLARKAVISKVEHFTLFNIMAKTPLFSISNLTVSPTEAKVGGTIVVSAEVSNKGEAQGTYTAVLAVDGVKIESKDVTLAPLASQKVSFNVSRNEPRNYSVSIAEQTGRFIVLPDSPPAPDPAPEATPAPALFTVSELVISPAEVKTGEPVDISAEIINKGGREGSYKLALRIDGNEVESKEVTLPPKTSQRVNFSVSKDKPGSYKISMAEQNGVFSVLAPPAPVAPEIAASPALLVISELVVSPKQVKTGETVSISAEVSNKGGSEGKFNLALTIDGNEVESKEVTLPPLASQKINFSLSKDKPGSYKISLGDRSDVLAVLAPARLDFSPQQYIILGLPVILAAAYILWKIYKTRSA